MNKVLKFWDFPGGQVVKTSPSNAGDKGSVCGWGAKISAVGELRSHMPYGQKKKQNMNNRNSIVTNSIKTLKMVHIYQSINITVLNKARI